MKKKHKIIPSPFKDIDFVTKKQKWRLYIGEGCKRYMYFETLEKALEFRRYVECMNKLLVVLSLFL